VPGKGKTVGTGRPYWRGEGREGGRGRVKKNPWAAKAGATRYARTGEGGTGGHEEVLVGRDSRREKGLKGSSLG